MADAEAVAEVTLDEPQGGSYNALVPQAARRQVLQASGSFGNCVGHRVSLTAYYSISSPALVPSTIPPRRPLPSLAVLTYHNSSSLPIIPFSQLS